MTEDEIIQVLGWDARYLVRHENDLLERVVRVVAKAVAAEREACAQTAHTALLGADFELTKRVLKAIRARGEK